MKNFILLPGKELFVVFETYRYRRMTDDSNKKQLVERLQKRLSEE